MNGQYALSSYIFVKMLMVHQLVYTCCINRFFNDHASSCVKKKRYCENLADKPFRLKSRIMVKIR